MVILELTLGFGNFSGDNIAHFAHLGGALIGFILVKIWNKTNKNSLY
jgi:rhomboid-like protein